MIQNQIPTKIQLCLTNASKKLRLSFPNDPKSNVRIIFKNKVYNLNKAHLWVQSNYFKLELKDKSELTITSNFQTEAFEHILSLFYGNQIQIKRDQILKYFQITSFLQIQTLYQQIRQDILINIAQYDIFTILKIAQTNNDQQLFQLVFEQLQKQHYTQLQMYKNELLSLDLGLFKLIIKSHNKSKAEKNKASQYAKIIEIIQNYCQLHYIQEDRYQEMVFSMLDITNLSAKEFKEIFLKKKNANCKASPGRRSSNKQGDSSNADSSFDISDNNSEAYYLGKLLEKNISIHNLKLDNIYLHKKIKQIESQNKDLKKQLKKLLTQSIQQQKIQKQIQNSFREINNQLRIQLKDQEDNKKNIFSKYSIMIQKLQQELNKKSQEIQTLTRCYSMQIGPEKQRKMKKNHGNKQSKIQNSVRQTKSETDNYVVTSQFLPASFIHQMMQGVQKQKQVIKPTSQKNSHTKNIQQRIQQQQDQQQIQQKYMDRLSFDKEPLTIQKKKIPTLSKLITQKGFNKKRLQLLFRRSTTIKNQSKSNVSSIGSRQDIFNRDNILILIKIITGQEIGCYITAKIPNQKNSCIQDKNGYMFSLTHNKKFKIKGQDQPDNIYVTDKYLLSISNYLLIASDCIKSKSFCFWPEKKNQDGISSSGRDKGKQKNKDKGGVQWFTGASQFYIQCIQIYQILDEQMEMVI